MARVKTTLEIPDPLYRRLKVSAAHQGKTVRAFVNETLVEKLRAPDGAAASVPAWRQAFGGLRHLRKETRRVEKTVAAEFSHVDPKDWQ
jgi:plasmid stability protein